MGMGGCMKHTPFNHNEAADAGGGGVRNSPTLGKLQRNVAFIYIVILCPPIRTLKHQSEIDEAMSKICIFLNSLCVCVRVSYVFYVYMHVFMYLCTYMCVSEAMC